MSHDEAAYTTAPCLSVGVWTLYELHRAASAFNFNIGLAGHSFNSIIRPLMRGKGVFLHALLNHGNYRGSAHAKGSLKLVFNLSLPS